MAELGRKTKRCPSDLTDEEWARIEPPLPQPSRRGRKPTVDLREVLNAIRYMARSAGGWRMLPVHFGPWQTVYSWFRRLVRDCEKRLDLSEAMIHVAIGAPLLRRVAHR